MATDRSSDTEQRPDREMSSDRSGGSEEQTSRFDGSREVSSTSPTASRPPYTLLIVAVVFAVVLLGLLLALLAISR